MSRVCAIAFACLNIVTLLFCSSMVFLSFLSLSNESLDVCSDKGYSGNLKFNIVMAILSFIGLIGLVAKIRIFLRMYVGITIVLFLVTLSSLQMGFYSMHTPEGRSMEYVKGDEYKLEHFSDRTKTKYLNSETWKITKKCMKQQGYCAEYIDAVNDLTSSDITFLHPLQVFIISFTFLSYKNSILTTLKCNKIMQGCCKPPKKCGYRQVNETYWAMPKTGPVDEEDMDCVLYSNGPELCYDCDACKAAYIGTQLGDRFQLTLKSIAWFLFCVANLTMACSSLKMIEKSLNTDEERAKLNSTVTPL